METKCLNHHMKGKRQGRRALIYPGQVKIFQQCIIFSSHMVHILNTSILYAWVNFTFLNFLMGFLSLGYHQITVTLQTGVFLAMSLKGQVHCEGKREL